MAAQKKQGKTEEYRCQFNKFDKDGNGKISRDEIRAVLKELKRDPTKEQLDACMEIDTDKSGFIEFGEFEQMMIKVDAEIEKNMKGAFDDIDKDKNGFISLCEMDGLFKSLGVTLTKADLEAELKKVDLNNDGKISFGEFKKLMCCV